MKFLFIFAGVVFFDCVGQNHDKLDYLYDLKTSGFRLVKINRHTEHPTEGYPFFQFLKENQISIPHTISELRTVINENDNLFKNKNDFIKIINDFEEICNTLLSNEKEANTLLIAEGLMLICNVVINSILSKPRELITQELIQDFLFISFHWCVLKKPHDINLNKQAISDIFTNYRTLAYTITRPLRRRPQYLCALAGPTILFFSNQLSRGSGLEVIAPYLSLLLYSKFYN